MVKITDKDILHELIYNHEDHTDNPIRYVFLKDIAEKYRVSPGCISRRIKKLEEKNMIKLNLRKTKLVRSITMNKNKIYTLTKKGIEYGGLLKELRNITVGPTKNPLSSYISLADLHGDLVLSFKVNHVPKDDPIEWDRTNKLNNGVLHKITHLKRNGDKISIELFKGSRSSKILLKPTLIADRHEDPEDLINSFIKVGYSIRRDFERDGYKLGLGDMKGEGKFTLRSKALEDIGYYEGEYFTIDQSKGVPEIHPKTGDLKTNKIMTDMVLKCNKKKPELEVLDDRDKINLLEDIGELSTMIKAVKNTEKRVKQTEKKVDLTSKYVGKLADQVNRLMDMLDQGVEDQVADQPDIGPPGGHMYG